MKKSTLLAAALIVAAVAAGIAASGQKPATSRTFTIDKSGQIKETTPAPKVKKPDTIVKTINGVNIYRGSKGGLYYWRTNAAGKSYKCYLKKEN